MGKATAKRNIEDIAKLQSSLSQLFGQNIKDAQTKYEELQPALYNLMGVTPEGTMSPGTPQQSAAADMVNRIQDLMKTSGPFAPDYKNIVGGFSDEIQQMQGAVKGLLSGERPLDPYTQMLLDQQQNVLENKLRSQMGPGYETSTGGATAMATFQSSRAAITQSLFASQLSNLVGNQNATAAAKSLYERNAAQLLGDLANTSYSIYESAAAPGREAAQNLLSTALGPYYAGVPIAGAFTNISNSAVNSWTDYFNAVQASKSPGFFAGLGKFLGGALGQATGMMGNSLGSMGGASIGNWLGMGGAAGMGAGGVGAGSISGGAGSALAGGIGADAFGAAGAGAGMAAGGAAAAGAGAGAAAGGAAAGAAAGGESSAAAVAAIAALFA